MRTAKDIVEDYRRRGYGDDRLRALANGRPEPIRSEILAYLDEVGTGDTPLAEAPAGELVADLLDARPDEMAIPDAPAPSVIHQDPLVGLAFEPDDEAPAAAESPVLSAEAVGAVEVVEPAEAEAAAAPVAATDDILAGLPAAPEVAAPRLAEVRVEHLTPAEYLARNCEAETIAVEPIDLRDPEAAEDFALDTEDTADLGEPWPSAESVEAAISEIPAAADEDVYFDLLDREEVLAGGEDRALQRTLDVIAQTLGDEAVREAMGENGNLINLHPPYAVAEGASAPVESEPGLDLPVCREESGLIKFPTEIIETYKTISSEVRHAAAQGDLFAGPVLAVELGEAELCVESDSVELWRDEALARQRQLKNLEEALALKEAELGRLQELLSDRGATLLEKEEALARLREAAAVADGDAAREAGEKCYALESEVATLRHRLAETEREFNVLKTGTVADLQQDKEDLLDIIGSQVGRQDDLNEALAVAGRRQALSYSLAAVASLLVVAMPVAHWIQSGRQTQRYQVAQTELAAKLSRTEAALQAQQGEKQLLARKLDEAARQRSIEHARYMQECASLKNEAKRYQSELNDKRQELARLSVRPEPNRPVAPTPESVARVNQTIGDQNALASAAVTPIHINQVKGVEEWRKRVEAARGQARPIAGETVAAAPINHAAPTVAAALPVGKVATVRKGDGLTHVLQRELGRADPDLIETVAKLNDLKRGTNGYLLIYPGQQLKLPAETDNFSRASR